MLRLPYVDLGGPVPYSVQRTSLVSQEQDEDRTVSYVIRSHLVDVIASGDAQNPWSEVARGRAWMWYDIADA